MPGPDDLTSPGPPGPAGRAAARRRPAPAGRRAPPRTGRPARRGRTAGPLPGQPAQQPYLVVVVTGQPLVPGPARVVPDRAEPLVLARGQAPGQLTQPDPAQR